MVITAPHAHEKKRARTRCGGTGLFLGAEHPVIKDTRGAHEEKELVFFLGAEPPG
jgi:hypothetical protein